MLIVEPLHTLQAILYSTKAPNHWMEVMSFLLTDKGGLFTGLAIIGFEDVCFGESNWK